MFAAPKPSSRYSLQNTIEALEIPSCAYNSGISSLLVSGFDILLHPFHLICFSSWRIMTPHYLVFALLEHGNHGPSPLQHSFGLFSSQSRYITNTTILPSPHLLIDSQAEYAHPTGVFIFTAQ